MIVLEFMVESFHLVKLTLTDLQDRELYYIEQRLFRFLPEYTYQNGIPIAHVKNLRLFRPNFDITSDYGNFNIDGNFLHMILVSSKMGHQLQLYQKNGFHFQILTVFQ